MYAAVNELHKSGGGYDCQKGQDIRLRLITQMSFILPKPVDANILMRIQNCL